MVDISWDAYALSLYFLEVDACCCPGSLTKLRAWPALSHLSVPPDPRSQVGQKGYIGVPGG